MYIEQILFQSKMYSNNGTYAPFSVFCDYRTYLRTDVRTYYVCTDGQTDVLVEIMI